MELERAFPAIVEQGWRLGFKLVLTLSMSKCKPDTFTETDLPVMLVSLELWATWSHSGRFRAEDEADAAWNTTVHATG